MWDAAKRHSDEMSFFYRCGLNYFRLHPSKMSTNILQTDQRIPLCVTILKSMASTMRP